MKVETRRLARTTRVNLTITVIHKKTYNTVGSVSIQRTSQHTTLATPLIDQFYTTQIYLRSQLRPTERTEMSSFFLSSSFFFSFSFSFPSLSLGLASGRTHAARQQKKGLDIISPYSVFSFSFSFFFSFSFSFSLADALFFDGRISVCAKVALASRQSAA